jgi:hypothetical protein
MKTGKQAVAYIKKHGVVLEGGRGSAPSLADAIVGEPISGGCWGHPMCRLAAYGRRSRTAGGKRTRFMRPLSSSQKRQLRSQAES